MSNILKKQNGFTLVEMMVVTLVVGITLAASIPSFSRLMRSSNLRSSGDQVASHFRLMRQKAVAEGQPYVLQFSNTKYYYLIEDTNGDGAYNSGEEFWGPHYLPTGSTVSSLSNGFNSINIGFNTNGSTNQGGNVNLINDRGEKMTLTLLRATGQVFIERPDDA